MPFTPHDPHITVAVVLGKMFWQFADPLDWMSEQFGVGAKVDRHQLMESIAMLRRGGEGIHKAYGEATGSDNRTRFRMQVFGRCEGRMVALCGMTISPVRIKLPQIEEIGATMAVMHAESVLGVQATHGLRSDMLEGVEQENKLIRLLPVNVFNRSFFQEKVEALQTVKACKVIHTVTASMVTLTKPWLFYDVSMARRKKLSKDQKALPF